MQGTDGVKVSEPAGLRVAAADNFTRQAQETRTEMNTLGNPSPQDCKQGDNTKIRKIELCLNRLRQSLPVTHGSGLSFLQLWPQPGSIPLILSRPTPTGLFCAHQLTPGPGLLCFSAAAGCVPSAWP